MWEQWLCHCTVHSAHTWESMGEWKPATTASTPAMGRFVQPMFSSCKFSAENMKSFEMHKKQLSVHICIDVRLNWRTCMLGQEVSRLVTRGPVRPEVPPRWSTWVWLGIPFQLILTYYWFVLSWSKSWSVKIFETWSPEFWEMALTAGASRQQFSRASFWNFQIRKSATVFTISVDHLQKPARWEETGKADRGYGCHGEV